MKWEWTSFLEIASFRHGLKKENKERSKTVSTLNSKQQQFAE